MKPSRTALYVAFFRALETEESGREPLFRDPWAGYFLPRGLRLAARLSRNSRLRGVIEHYVDGRAPGARASLIGRTRYIDDVVRREIKSGTRQLVILGAGFDCRAHRMPELSGTRVFEVDRPQTQLRKRAVVERHRAQARPLTYVEVDFQRDDLKTRLLQCGWDSKARTTFVWEGVTSYLTQEAVDAVLAFVGQATPGSALVFTYLHRDVIHAPEKNELSSNARDYVRNLGEPWTYGIDPQELGPMLSRFGLSLEDDLGADEYPQRYALAADMRGYGFNRIALARVG